MPSAKVNGLNLNYEIRGTGPCVLFIHGIGADLKHPLGIFNTAVPQHFTVLAYDPRGIGESDSPAGPYTIADLADDAAELAAVVGWDRYHVLGTSFGGMVAQELALRHPAAVDKLVLGVTNAGGANAGPRVDNLHELSTIEKLRLSDIRQDAAWAAANPEKVAAFEAQSRAMTDAMRADPKLAAGFAAQAQAVIIHDTFDRLPQITAPTLVFAGRYDGSNPPERTKAMADRISGARYELLESGHGNWYSDPAAWEMIIDFLRGN